MNRLVIAACLVFAGLGGLASHGVAGAATGGNSDAAHMCQLGGYLTLQGSDGTTFKNEGQCVSYAARGGTISGVPACTVSATTGCLTFNNATLPSETGNGTSITLTGATSFVTACASASAGCFFSPPNNLATGGGTYTETNDVTHAVISSGIYRIDNTAGASEGLAFLFYSDSSRNPVSSCAAATGLRLVGVRATLIDSTTGAQRTPLIGASTDTLVPPSQGFVIGNSDDENFIGAVPASTITC